MEQADNYEFHREREEELPVIEPDEFNEDLTDEENTND